MEGSTVSFARVKELLREQRYRRKLFDVDRKQTALVMTGITAGFSLATPNDFALLRGTQALGAALLCRLLAVVALGVALVALRGVKRPAQQDRVFVGWLGAWSLLQLGALATRYPTGECVGPLIGEGVALCAIYLGQRGPIAPRIVGASITTAGVIVLFWSPHAALSSAARLTGTTLLIAGNFGAAATALSLEGQRRDHFKVEQELAVKVRELAVEKERALATSRARAAFLAAMSHEFRTPMNAVIGLSEIVLDTPLSLENRRHVGTISESARALLRLLEDILDFAKIDAQKLRLSPAPFDLRRLAGSVVDMLRPAADARALALSLDVSPDVPAAIFGDDARLRQVLVNLVSNAVKFTDRGEITLRIAARSAAGDHHEITICVEDSGDGIAPEVMARLFQPFEQGDGSITRRHGGTGLGLAISRQIVRAMGGDIHVESAPGRGSRFSFTLRVAAATLAPEAAPLAPREGRPPLAILVVDDHPINREVAHAKLSRIGHAVDLASDGQEALLAASARDYDVIFMDLQMPRMSGIEATERLRERLAGRRAPHIIAMTASLFEADREACRRAGMRDFVGKPIDLAQLDAVLCRVAEERGAVSPPLSRDALAKLESIQTPGEGDFFAQLCEIFKADAQRRLSRMGDALGRRDTKALESEAHALRTASASLGALEMSQLCGRIEVQASEGDVDELGVWVSALSGKLEAVERALALEVRAS